MKAKNSNLAKIARWEIRFRDSLGWKPKILIWPRISDPEANAMTINGSIYWLSYLFLCTLSSWWHTSIFIFLAREKVSSHENNMNVRTFVLYWIPKVDFYRSRTRSELPPQQLVSSIIFHFHFLIFVARWLSLFFIPSNMKENPTIVVKWIHGSDALFSCLWPR